MTEDEFWLNVVTPAVARRIAKRQNGERYEGYESSHHLAAYDYVETVRRCLEAGRSDMPDSASLLASQFPSNSSGQ